MKKKLIILGIAVILIGGWLALKPNPKKEMSNKPVVKIGFIAPLTGPAAEVGLTTQAGAELALEDLKETHLHYEIILEDDRLEPKRSALVINKLIHTDKVSNTISISSGTGNVVSPIALKNGIFHFSIASDSNIAKGETNFIHWTPPHKQAQKLRKYLKEKGVKKLTMITISHPGAQALEKALRHELKRHNLSIETFVFNVGERDFKTLLSRVKSTRPEIIFPAAFSPEIDILGRQMKEMGINTPITGIEMLSFAQNKSLFEGAQYVDSPVGNTTLLERAKEKTGSDSTFAIAFAYDCVRLIVKLHEDFYRKHNRIPTGEELATALRNLEGYVGQVGPISVGPNGVISSNAILKEIKDGKLVVIEE